MSISPNSPWRGCAANFRQPVSANDRLAAQCLVETVYYVNCRQIAPPLHDIEYRSSSGENDTRHRVFRWDLTPYEEVFANGFEARRLEDTVDEVFFNLDQYVHHGCRPLDTRRRTSYAFVSTTLSNTWHPSANRETPEREVYRYEIYAPGGIWVRETLGDRYEFTDEDEVSFVAGIAPQYIRSAQLFRLTFNPATRRTEVARVPGAGNEYEIVLNGNFDPQSHPPRWLEIEDPIFDYEDANGRLVHLNQIFWLPGDIAERQKRQANSTDSDTTDWYARDVANCKSYINASFRSSCTNEAYLFMKNEYVLLNYAPGTTDDKVLNGPLFICDGYPSLTDTAFAEHGIDCAFGSHNWNEAFIFSGNLCAQINFAPGTTDDKIIKGPMTIKKMFPFFKGTVFESGVDAVFESTRGYEAYLFQDNQYALINYGSDSSDLIAVRLIREGYPSLKNTIFEN